MGARPAPTNVFVPTAEAAFIEGVSDRDVQRLTDERPVTEFNVRHDGRRLPSRLGAALGSFYLKSDSLLSASARLMCISQLFGTDSKNRVESRSRV